MADFTAPSPFVINMALSSLGLTYEQKEQVTAQIPTIAHMVSAVNNANPLVQEFNALYIKAQPLIEVLLADWKKAGPALQILLNALADRKLAAPMRDIPVASVRDLLDVLVRIEQVIGNK